jgi:hypothetical protein
MSKCWCTDSGLVLTCATLTFSHGSSIVGEKNFLLPTISSKDLFFLIVTLSAVHLPQSIWPVQFSATCHQCVLRSFECILVKFI